MKRNELLDSAATPDGTLLTLHRHDGAYYMKADGVELMSTRRHASEDRLAELVCAPIAERGAAGAMVLIGGLGFGFTLRSALRTLAADARVVVVEIVAEVIRWNQNADYALAWDALSDPRVELMHGDVWNAISERRGRFDGIILDVDNGAEAMTAVGNARLYDVDGIRATAAALRPGGLLAYWSSVADEAFERALRGAALDVTAVRAHAHGARGARHFIYVCSSAAGASHQTHREHASGEHQ